jgi:hypothetical protein
VTQATGDVRPQSILHKPLFSFTELEPFLLHLEGMGTLLGLVVQGEMTPGVDYAAGVLQDRIGEFRDFVYGRFEQARAH